MGRTMSKDDLKLYLHSAATRAKYPWVQVWSDNADKLLEAAGLLSSSSSGSTMGGTGSGNSGRPYHSGNSGSSRWNLKY